MGRLNETVTLSLPNADGTFRGTFEFAFNYIKLLTDLSFSR